MNKLTYTAAAQYLGISVRTLVTLVSLRRVRCVRPSARCVRFLQVDLDKYLDQTANKAA